MSLVKKDTMRPSAGNKKAYFNYVLRHNWQHLVFYMILMLLVVVLPTVMTVNSHENMRTYSYEQRLDYGNEYSFIACLLTFIASCAVSVFAFMSSAGYVNSKQAVGCFHSFPLSRGFIFLTETGVKGIYYLVSLCVTTFLSSAVIRLNFPVSGEATVWYLRLLLLAILAYCLFFSIGMLAAGLAGTGLLRFLLFGVIVGLPIAVYALVCAACGLGMPDVNMNAYLDFNIIKWLCPITILADVLIRFEEINFGLSVLFILIPVVLFYGGALLLHLKRRSEMSGTPIIWKPMFGIIKYAVIFLCTLGGTLFWGSITNDGGWYFFGGLCGLILSFMLTNVILYRSVRALFKGIRGLCVMGVVMVLFSMFTVGDIANLNAHMWSAGNTRSLTVSLDDTTVTYTDDEDIDTLVPLLKEFMDNKYTIEWEGVSRPVLTMDPIDLPTRQDIEYYLPEYYSKEYYDKYGYYDEQAEDGFAIDFEILPHDYLSLDWGQLPYVGIPSHKQTRLEYNAKTKALIEFIVTSDEYAAVLNEVNELPLDSLEDMSVRILDFSSVHFYADHISGNDVKKAFTRLSPYFNYTNEKRNNSPIVGRISLWGGEKRYILPVYAEDYEIINLYGEWIGQEFNFKSADDVYDYQTNQTTALFLIDVETGMTVSVKDKAERKEIIRGLPQFEIVNATPPETDGKKYVAILCYRDGENENHIISTPIRTGLENSMEKYFAKK